MEKKRLKKTKVKRKKRVVRHANQRYYVGKDLNKPPPITMTTHIHNYGMRKYLDPNPRMILERHVNSVRQMTQQQRQEPVREEAIEQRREHAERRQQPNSLPPLPEPILRPPNFYSEMNVADMKRILRNRNIPIKRGWRKADLIQKLQESDV